MIGDLILLGVEVLGEALLGGGSGRRSTRSRERLQRKGILDAGVRAADGSLRRHPDEWLSGRWHVSPGLVTRGSTKLEIHSVDDEARDPTWRDGLRPADADIIVTARGPGPMIEIAMAAEWEAWFREAVARTQ